MTAPWWRPDRLATRRANIAVRGRVKRAVRDFFDATGYVEVETPALQPSPGLESHLQAFATVLHDPRDPGARPRYLHTSPEFAMKKLLVGGIDHRDLHDVVAGEPRERVGPGALAGPAQCRAVGCQLYVCR